MGKDLSRRKFLEQVGVGTAAGMGCSLLGEWAEGRPANPDELPTRILGRTGAKVSILAFGCGSRFLMYKDEDKALEVLNHAIDLGIDYSIRPTLMATARARPVWARSWPLAARKCGWPPRFRTAPAMPLCNAWKAA